MYKKFSDIEIKNEGNNHVYHLHKIMLYKIPYFEEKLDENNCSLLNINFDNASFKTLIEQLYKSGPESDFIFNMTSIDEIGLFSYFKLKYRSISLNKYFIDILYPRLKDNIIGGLHHLEKFMTQVSMLPNKDDKRLDKYSREISFLLFSRSDQSSVSMYKETHSDIWAKIVKPMTPYWFQLLIILNTHNVILYDLVEKDSKKIQDLVSKLDNIEQLELLISFIDDSMLSQLIPKKDIAEKLKSKNDNIYVQAYPYIAHWLSFIP